MRSDYTAALDADQCPICGAFAWKRAADRPAVPSRTIRFLRWEWTTPAKPHRAVAICQECYNEQEYADVNAYAAGTAGALTA